MHNLIQYSQSTKAQGTSAEDDIKFNILPIDCTISNKSNIVANHNNTAQVKPCKSYIEITFNKETTEVPFFQYIVLQNFYTYSFTVKQFKSSGLGEIREQKKSENNWVTVLKEYQLMRNAHFETDAQNWHIIGTELVHILSI